MDYYNILGVSKASSQDDIKKAYRKLAGKHHPDRGGDEAEFKRIQEAYETLGDENKRAQYDNPQSQFGFGGFQNGPFGPGFGGGFDDFFGQFHQQQHRQRQQYRNPDAVVTLNIDCVAVYEGRDVVVDAGFTREIINIPKGARDNSKVRVHGKGHHRFKEAPPGDLVVRFHIRYPAGVSRDNDDMYQRLTINAFDAILGASINFEHFSGRKFSLKIPAGSQPGSKLRLSNMGMPNPQTGKPGNLFVVLNIEIPHITDVTLLDKLEDIRQEVKK